MKNSKLRRNRIIQIFGSWPTWVLQFNLCPIITFILFLEKFLFPLVLVSDTQLMRQIWSIIRSSWLQSNSNSLLTRHHHHTITRSGRVTVTSHTTVWSQTDSSHSTRTLYNIVTISDNRGQNWSVRVKPIAQSQLIVDIWPTIIVTG